nr:hypothetical protein [uncultured Olsenella sp.]
MIPMARLRGLPIERAELYGKPHVGAAYVGSRYERTTDRCVICGRPAESCHHVAHRSWGQAFRLVARNGAWSLRSPLLALCGDGTRGCHDGFHGGARFFPRWEWDEERYRAQWWDGLLLARMHPHDPELYLYGRWVIEDRGTGMEIEIREAY